MVAIGLPRLGGMWKFAVTGFYSVTAIYCWSQNIKNRDAENKISALEFLNKPEMKNLLGQFQSKLSGYSDIVVKGEKFTRDLKKNYLEFDGLFDELFILIQDFGLKREEKKNKITK